MRLVAIHGLGCSADQGWPRVAAALAPDHELLVTRLHGADGPTREPTGTWGIRAQAERIARDVRPDDILVGHSMGGTIATRVAQRVGTLRALVLIEPHVVPRAGFVVRPTLERDAARAPGAEYFERFAAIATGEGSYAESLARWDWRVLHQMSSELARGDGGAPSWTDTLASFRFPVHVVWGGASDDAGEDVHGAALRRLALPFHIVAGSKHFIPSEKPEALADVLRAIAEKG